MISVTEAITLIQEQAIPTQTISLSLSDSYAYFLAEDLYSPIDMPNFAQSAMDGYALHFESFKLNEILPVVATIPAGATHLPMLQPYQAMRIFTGAPIPPGADTVVMQEKVIHSEKGIQIIDTALFKGANVRPQASQTAKGDLIVKQNTQLNAGIIGLLASLGIEKVNVYDKPKVAIVITGKELVAQGNSLMLGQVYESNSFTLKAALSALNISIVAQLHIQDSLIETENAITSMLPQADILIITGGISVGDYDFVQKALENVGVQPLFYKVKQKPGKPLFVGKTPKTLIFALPGNPAAVHTCFYRYIQPYILQIMGHQNSFSPTTRLKLNQAFEKKNELTHFLKARKLDDGTVDILSHQESYKMNDYVLANGFVCIAADKNSYQKGDEIAFFSY